jgi:anti-anti-sigma factor
MKLHTVRLQQLPVEIHRLASEHTDAINRELVFITNTDDDSVPARLRALSERLTEQYSDMTASQSEQLREAQDSDAASIDLVDEIPGQVVEAAEELEAMLDEVDEFCRRGELLSLVTPPELVRYRKWFLGEFVRQIRDGAEPCPWQGSEGTGESAPRGDGDASVTGDQAARVLVQGALDLDGASRLRSIVAANLDEGRSSLVFDLRDCDFVDSVGLSLLLTTRNRCVERGGRVVVENLHPFVRTTFLHAGVLDLLSANGES